MVESHCSQVVKSTDSLWEKCLRHSAAGRVGGAVAVCCSSVLVMLDKGRWVESSTSYEDVAEFGDAAVS